MRSPRRRRSSATCRDDPSPVSDPTVTRATHPTDWLTVDHGVIGLRGCPPDGEMIALAFSAAARTSHAHPSAELLDWFANRHDVVLTWTDDDTASLVRLLRAHEPTGWQLLEDAGVLERAIPEIAIAFRRRRAGAGAHDMDATHRFKVAERLDDLAAEIGHPSDDLVLAALAVDVCADAEPPSCLASLLDRLVAPARAERVAAIVADARMLRASADDPQGFELREVLQLATHLATVAHAREAYQLALALGARSVWRHDALDERHALIDSVLDHPEIAGSEAPNLAEARRLAAQRLLTDAGPITRLATAPASYVLSHGPDELARQVCLIEPLPPSGTVRVAVTPTDEPGHWKIDVACRDTDALLAHLTEALADRGLDIVDATIATWPDGGVLDSFIVFTTNRPVARDLAGDVEERLVRRPSAPTAAGLVAEFNGEVLPWHTVCDVIGPDQPGALSAVSAAFARAEVVVHTARIATSDRIIHDRFTVSDRAGNKLDDAAIRRVQRELAGHQPGR